MTMLGAPAGGRALELELRALPAGRVPAAARSDTVTLAENDSDGGKVTL
jgi:hypothetical protein